MTLSPDSSPGSLWIIEAGRILPLSISNLPPEHPLVARTETLVEQMLADVGLSLPAPEADAPDPLPSLDDGHELAVALVLIGHRLGLSPRRSLLIHGALVGQSALVGDASEHDLLQLGLCLSAQQALAVLLSGRRPALSEPSAAERLSGRLGLDLMQSADRVIGVHDLAGACCEVFPLLDRARDGLSALPDRDLGQAIERLFWLALQGPPPALGWRLVAALGSGLLLRVPADRMLRWKAAFVRDVARRHQGEAVLMAWPGESLLEIFPRSIRLQIVAHLVQSAADGDPASVPQYIEDALPLLSEPPQPDDARLLGALGRAHASCGAHEDAARMLRRAVDAWQALGLRADSSYALCELLRVLGLLGKQEDVLQFWRELAGPYLADPACAEPGKPFVRLAAARALVQAGCRELALPLLLPDALWEPAARHVQTARLRWLAHAQRLHGQPTQAIETEQALALLGDTDQLHLCRLDRTLLDGSDWQPHASALLEALDGGEEASLQFRRLTASGAPPDRLLWERLAWQYRY